MTVPLQRQADGDGRTGISLAELIAIRSRVGKAALPQQMSRASRTGHQSSRLYGRGMDYAESRVYQPGDDVRRLDWRLTARSGELHTKLFQEEREGRLLIMVDGHAGMQFGTRVRFKSVQAARAAAWAAWYAIKAGERVGVLGFGPHEEWLAPRSGPRGALAVCGALADWQAYPADAQEERLSVALQRTRRALHGATRILLITDGGCSDDAAQRHLTDLGRMARLAVLAVVDPLEIRAIPPGRYPVEHEGVQSDLVVQTERQQQAFLRGLGAGHARLVALARAAGVPCRTVTTEDDPFEATAALLGARGAWR